MTTFVRLVELAKRFGESEVLRDLSLDVERGEVLALLGPSGSGKTTLLRCLAGFEIPDAGRILVDGQEVTRLPPERRDFGMVFQHYALFPHLSVGENVAFGLEARRWPPERVRARVEEVLALVRLPGLEGRRVSEISGGMQQRVALARALAPEPRLLLLDEPLSNLDPSLREATRRELRRSIERIGITTLLVTHEQEEAFDLGDRVAVLHGGRLDQVGRPEELYGRPRTRFVAEFVGRASALPARLPGGGRAGESGRAAWLVRRDGRPGPTWPAEVGEEVGEEVDLLVRPEALALAEAQAPAVHGRAAARRFAGPFSYLRVELDELAGSPQAEVLVSGELPAAGAEVWIAPRPDGPPPQLFRPRRGEA
jgi:ABC-type Fe3+/spermidine/putrescine transport system ATPase subunit